MHRKKKDAINAKFYYMQTITTAHECGIFAKIDVLTLQRGYKRRLQSSYIMILEAVIRNFQTKQMKEK